MSDDLQAALLEVQGDQLWQRLGYYTFMVIVGVYMPGDIGLLVFGYGLTRMVVIIIRLARTVLALRSSVRG